MKQVHSQALQQSLKDLSIAIKEAFDKSSPKQFPRFKKKGQRDSFRYPQGFKIDNDKVNPKNTSRKCPKCGYISSVNRKTQATFCCQQKDCNYTANADYVGSLNIREAGLALLGLGGSSWEHPMKSQPTEGV